MVIHHDFNVPVNLYCSSNFFRFYLVLMTIYIFAFVTFSKAHTNSAVCGCSQFHGITLTFFKKLYKWHIKSIPQLLVRLQCKNILKLIAPGAPLTNFNDGGGGGVQQKFIFYTQKNHNFRICLPKKITIFFATQKIPLFFFSRPKKIPASFVDPKKSLLAKISDPKKSLGPPLSLKYVSGSPGLIALGPYPTLRWNQFSKFCWRKKLVNVQLLLYPCGRGVRISCASE